ncbi:hypothetical protein [Saccharothrix variisporea]|uniref:Uncharacterized protein n=1 Tax=Saccharothrix variisporea TaxID=543527 RepID=A0A495XCP6_9PSEU|nr:hypothetical protein [Saccharothrix variisporea]RKT71767.1 hypothetical protein DFJ66_5062 [Saccharothrix variisporea]
MDERKLAELFRDAAGGAPPPSFDVGSVRAESARVTARRRTQVALGSTLAVVLLFGGVLVSANLGRSSNDMATSAGSAQDAPSPNLTATPFVLEGGEPRAETDQRGGLPPKSIPDDPSTQGDGTSGTTGRDATGGTSGCQEVDRELAVALADKLPAAEGLQPAPAAAQCPPGSRGASFLVRDGAIAGVVSVVLVPKGGSTVPSAATAEASSPAKAGVLHVLSEPEAGSAVAPFAGELASLARELAAQF